jgi:hypothetical protein
MKSNQEHLREFAASVSADPKPEPPFDQYLQVLDAAKMKTSVLIAQFTGLSIRGRLGDGPQYALLQQRIAEMANEIDRRLPGPSHE